MFKSVFQPIVSVFIGVLVVVFLFFNYSDVKVFAQESVIGTLHIYAGSAEYTSPSGSTNPAVDGQQVESDSTIATSNHSRVDIQYKNNSVTHLAENSRVVIEVGQSFSLQAFIQSFINQIYHKFWSPLMALVGKQTAVYETSGDAAQTVATIRGTANDVGSKPNCGTADTNPCAEGAVLGVYSVTQKLDSTKDSWRPYDISSDPQWGQSKYVAILPTSQPIPTPTNSPTPTITNTPTPSSSPTSTINPTPTLTVVPTPTITVIPTAIPTAIPTISIVTVPNTTITPTSTFTPTPTILVSPTPTEPEIESVNPTVLVCDNQQTIDQMVVPATMSLIGKYLNSGVQVGLYDKNRDNLFMLNSDIHQNTGTDEWTITPNIQSFVCAGGDYDIRVYTNPSVDPLKYITYPFTVQAIAGS